MNGNVSSASAPGQRGLLECLFDLLSDTRQPIFASLKDDLHANGLGDIIDSWIGTGQNLPVNAAQIQQGMGEARTLWLADAANPSPARVRSCLVELLPILVNTLTPGGKLPDQNTLTKCLSFMRSRLLDR